MSTLTTPAEADALIKPRMSADQAPGFGSVLKSEWIKFISVRSSWWTVLATFVLGAGLTIVMCWGNADWLASADADEVPGAFITWGMMIAQICAVVIGALAVTTEYGTHMAHSTFAAVPARGKVLAAKAILVSGVMFVVGTAAALVGYFGGNYFLEREGIGLALEGDVLRAMYGSGLFLAAIALFTVGVGFLVRHTAGTISVVLALMLILGNMVNLVPGELGEWMVKLMPGNAGLPISTPVAFNPDLLDPWTGFAVLCAETALVLGVAWAVLRRRDA